jgi:hypothetical protein
MRLLPFWGLAILASLALASPGSAQGVPVPYFESFENPAWPGPEWTIAVSAPGIGRVQALALAPASPDGGRVASFDVSTSSTYSTNQLTIGVDLAAAPSAVLRYWAKETGDETDLEDGLFLNDGASATWVKVVDHATLTSAWTEVTVVLATAASANGIPVTSNFKIRFSQRDNFPTPTDGMQIDGVRIEEPPTGQANSALAFLAVNGGSAPIGAPGPFVATATGGNPVTFAVQGPPNQPFLLASGPANANNAIIPGIGSLDLGLFGISNLGDVQILLDGTAPGFLNSLAKTGPAGSSSLTFTLPALPSGPWLGFQAAVFDGPVLTLTAATLITVP